MRMFWVWSQISCVLIFPVNYISCKEFCFGKVTTLYFQVDVIIERLENAPQTKVNFSSHRIEAGTKLKIIREQVTFVGCNHSRKLQCTTYISE